MIVQCADEVNSTTCVSLIEKEHEIEWATVLRQRGLRPPFGRAALSTSDTDIKFLYGMME